MLTLSLSEQDEERSHFRPLMVFSISQTLIGLTLTAAGWMVVRWFAGATTRSLGNDCLDAGVPAAVFAVLVALTAKPITCGVGMFELLLAIAFADAAKRRILREPIVFFDVYQTADVIIRHPQVDILESMNRWTALTVCAGLAGPILVMMLESTLWVWTPWPGLFAISGLALGGWAIAGPLLDPTAAVLRNCDASGDATADAAKLGFFAMQIVHVVLARAERPERQAASRAGGLASVRRTDASFEGPVIVVQSESFFDARRLDCKVPADLLPAFDRCRESGAQWGRLSVPGFGGNTMRTEFAALTGLSEAAIGFDRFNPYQAFARKPVRSLAWRLRGEGYRTVCIHPFDRRFYRRDIVMKNLGFDFFLSQEEFSQSPPAGDYIRDIEVAAVTLDLLRETGPKLFVFAITMQNHGPWTAEKFSPQSEIGARIPVLADDLALSGLIAGLHESDQMLGTLSEALAERNDDGLIAFYGDHLPGFPETFDRLGFADRRSDYVIARTKRGPARRIDLAAHELPDAIIASLATRSSETGESRRSVAIPTMRLT